MTAAVKVVVTLSMANASSGRRAHCSPDRGHQRPLSSRNRVTAGQPAAWHWGSAHRRPTYRPGPAALRPARHWDRAAPRSAAVQSLAARLAAARLAAAPSAERRSAENPLAPLGQRWSAEQWARRRSRRYSLRQGAAGTAKAERPKTCSDSWRQPPKSRPGWRAGNRPVGSADPSAIRLPLPGSPSAPAAARHIPVTPAGRRNHDRHHECSGRA